MHKDKFNRSSNKKYDEGWARIWKKGTADKTPKPAKPISPTPKGRKSGPRP